MNKHRFVIALSIILLTYLGACGTPSTPRQAPQPTDPPVSIPIALTPMPLTQVPFVVILATFNASETSTPNQGITLPPHSCISTNSPKEVGEVTNVVDGDTIDVRIGSEIKRVRYIGIDTPEQGELGYGTATLTNSDLVRNKEVTLYKDVSNTDRYNRILRYVFVGNIFVNRELVLEGFALPATYPPDVACVDVFREANTQARLAGIGLYGVATSPPVVQPIATSLSNCDPSYPTVCIPRYPPDLDCGEISFRRFQVIGSDPHGFDGDNDGIGCESG